MTTPNDILMATLRRALSLKRPHGSAEEGTLLLSLAVDAKARHPDAPMFVDAAGNLHVDLRRRFPTATRGHFKSKHRTLFVAHVDTVHRTPGANVFDSSGVIWRAQGGVPLGADDGAGVAMLAALIHAGRPAYYVFTRGEERGGVGAKHLADEHAALLCQFDRAIAFDRKDIISVITHQGWGRCCSDAFAEALCAGLNDRGMLVMPDDGGVYTDTAEFVDFIPECTNISAGYYDEHSDRESLDTSYLQSLLAAALTLDWDGLPTERDPQDDTDDWNSWRSAVPYTHQKKTAAILEKIEAADDPEIEAALDRWAKNELAERVAREDDFDDVRLADVANDPFAWSDDGKTVKTGSGKKPVASIDPLRWKQPEFGPGVRVVKGKKK